MRCGLCDLAFEIASAGVKHPGSRGIAVLCGNRLRCESQCSECVFCAHGKIDSRSVDIPINLLITQVNINIPINFLVT